jgi:hypothetical protein
MASIERIEGILWVQREMIVELMALALRHLPSPDDVNILAEEITRRSLFAPLSQDGHDAAFDEISTIIASLQKHLRAIQR